MPIYEVTITLNGNNLGNTKIEAEDENEAIEIVEAEIDLNLDMKLVGTININSDEFDVNEEFQARDVDVEAMFGAIEYSAIELEEEEN